MSIIFRIFLITAIVYSCQRGSQNKEAPVAEKKPQEQPQAEQPEGWDEVRSSLVSLESYDNERILEAGQGFFVEGDLVVTRLSMIGLGNRVLVRTSDSGEKFEATEYVGVDRINDLIILRVKGVTRPPVELFKGTVPNSAKSMYISGGSEKTIQLFTGKVLNLATVNGTKIYRITNRIRSSAFGTPVFVSNKQVIGMAFSATVSYELQSFATPSFYILELLERKKKTPESLETLRVVSDERVAAMNRKIKGLVLETDMGEITIRLFNETPQYRDNFIRLVRENYFDNLLFHRVIRDFGIQSGAADTRYAKKGDIVGYKGPGYTLPAHIVPGLFHRRGVIGSPRKPDTQNEKRRSDGSQFYIVSGRKYFDEELNELEKQNQYKFSQEQRNVYKTTGGAPHLDGSYTVFGEVISGMHVVDSMVQVETDRDWRPVMDVRLKRVRILE